MDYGSIKTRIREKAWALILVCVMGCSPTPKMALMNPPALFQDEGGLRLWVDPNEVKNKTVAEIRALNIGCLYELKPERRQECMRLLFEFHQKVTGQPYWMTIVENWMKSYPVETIDRGDMLLLAICETQWQWGDLDADGRVDMKDFAVYANLM